MTTKTAFRILISFLLALFSGFILDGTIRPALWTKETLINVIEWMFYLWALFVSVDFLNFLRRGR